MDQLMTYPPFDLSDKASLGQRWQKYIDRFNNYLTAMSITDNNRKKALLLHFAGPDVYDIYDTLDVTVPAPQEGQAAPDVYTITVTALTNHFEPKSNHQYNVYQFRQTKQTRGENLDKFYTRLKKQAQVCKFQDEDEEVKSQVIMGCLSNKLRRMGLEDSDMTLSKILDKGRALEASERQAKEIESYNNEEDKINSVHGKQKGYRSTEHQKFKSRKPTKCGLCGGHYPHDGGASQCPAYNAKCHNYGRLNHFAKMCRSKEQSITTKPKQKGYKHKYKKAKGKVNQAQAISSSSESSDYEQSDDSCDENYVYAVKSIATLSKASMSGMPTIPTRLLETTVHLLIDTGAGINLIDEITYKSLKPNPPPLKHTTMRIKPYGSPALTTAGKFKADISHKSRKVRAKFFVVKGADGNLMSRKLAEDLGVVLITSINNVGYHENLIGQFSDIFNGVGLLKDLTIKLHIKDDIPPVARPHRRVPINLRDQVESAINDLMAQDIIEPVTEGPTPWISQPVFVTKPNGSLRLCIDMRAANKAIERTRHVVPTIDEILSDLNQSSVFSKLDLNQGYHQLMLDTRSRHITTFSTHLGLFRYKRLNFGINCASEIFQNAVHSVLKGIPDVINVSDDILIYSKNTEAHRKTLQDVFQRLRDSGLTLKQEKCQLFKTSLKYLGYIFTKDGVKPDPDKVRSIREAPTPTNASEVRSFMGMVTFCARFIPHLATTGAPLMELTHKNTKWKWTRCHDEAFKAIKNSITEKLAYYDPRLPTSIRVDASPVGVAAILTQKTSHNNLKIISYASRALTAVEQRYSQIEREALAILFGCEKFKLYVLGKPVEVITDHKPLIPMFKNPNLKLPARIERWVLKLQAYNLQVSYAPGRDNPADFMSRHPLPYKNPSDSDTIETYINFITSVNTPAAMTQDRIAESTKHDKILQTVLKSVETGQWHQDDEKVLSSYKKVCSELSMTSLGILLRGQRIVLPQNLWQEAIALAHEGHQGMSKSKAMLRAKVWFPGMDQLLEDKLKNCIACQATTSTNKPAPLQMSELPPAPWTELSADFFGPLPTGEHLLLVIDDYSRFPIVETLSSTSARCTIPVLDRIVSTFGIPKVIRTDNGPPFNSQDFANAAKHLGFHHRKITPRWPQANGEAERFMRNLKKILQIARMEGKPWKRELQIFLRAYRSTPHSTTGVSPHKLLFGREPGIKLPSTTDIDKSDDAAVRIRDSAAKHKMKTNADKKRHASHEMFHVGDHVLVKNENTSKLTPKYDPNPAVVLKTSGTMVTVVHKGRDVTRNIPWFKLIPKQPLAPVREQPVNLPRPQNTWAPSVLLCNTGENNAGPLVDRNELIQDRPGQVQDPADRPPDIPVPGPDNAGLPQDRPIRQKTMPSHLKDYVVNVHQCTGNKPELYRPQYCEPELL